VIYILIVYPKGNLRNSLKGRLAFDSEWIPIPKDAKHDLDPARAPIAKNRGDRRASERDHQCLAGFGG